MIWLLAAQTSLTVHEFCQPSSGRQAEAGSFNAILVGAESFRLIESPGPVSVTDTLADPLFEACIWIVIWLS